MLLKPTLPKTLILTIQLSNKTRVSSHREAQSVKLQLEEPQAF